MASNTWQNVKMPHRILGAAHDYIVILLPDGSVYSGIDGLATHGAHGCGFDSFARSLHRQPTRWTGHLQEQLAGRSKC